MTLPPQKKLRMSRLRGRVTWGPQGSLVPGMRSQVLGEHQQDERRWLASSSSPEHATQQGHLQGGSRAPGCEPGPLPGPAQSPQASGSSPHRPQTIPLLSQPSSPPPCSGGAEPAGLCQDAKGVDRCAPACHPQNGACAAQTAVGVLDLEPADPWVRPWAFSLPVPQSPL